MEEIENEESQKGVRFFLCIDMNLDKHKVAKKYIETIENELKIKCGKFNLDVPSLYEIENAIQKSAIEKIEEIGDVHVATTHTIEGEEIKKRVFVIDAEIKKMPEGLQTTGEKQ